MVYDNELHDIYRDSSKLAVINIAYKPIHVDQAQLALVDKAEHSIIELAQYSQSLENGKSIFTGRGSYILLSIDCWSLAVLVVTFLYRANIQTACSS